MDHEELDSFSDEFLDKFLRKSKRDAWKKFGRPVVKCRQCTKVLGKKNITGTQDSEHCITLKLACQDCKKITAFSRSAIPAGKRRRIEPEEKSEGSECESRDAKVGRKENSGTLTRAKSLIDSLPTISVSVDNCNLLYFDLETSSFSSTADILQIAGKVGENEFSVYINPTQPIDFRASEVTGLKNINGRLFLHDRRVTSVPITAALTQFREFLNLSSKPCILVAHSATFDSDRLLRAIINNSMIESFTKIAGFSDSCIALKRRYPERKGAGMFKLEKLAQDFLEVESNRRSHEALYDASILKELASLLIPPADLIDICKSYKESVMVSLITPHLASLKGRVSEPIIKKLALEGITYKDLQKVYAENGEDGIGESLSRKGTDNRPIVTKDRKVIQKIIESLEKTK